MSFVKWAGGKRKLVPVLKDYFPQNINVYFEPFVGGGALFFNLWHENRFQSSEINDLNFELITTYRIISNDVKSLTSKLDDFKDQYLKNSEETFLKIRAINPSSLTDVEIAARFLFLNKTCFNGLYRVNKSGKFNSPWGKYEKPNLYNEVILEEWSTALKDKCRAINCLDFEKAVGNAVVGDAIYFDPPYIPLNPTSSFTSYTPGGFNLPEQERLAKCFKKHSDAGVFCVLSNSDTKITRELYKNFKIHEVKAARSINSNGGKRGKITELIITSK